MEKRKVLQLAGLLMVLVCLTALTACGSSGSSSSSVSTSEAEGGAGVESEEAGSEGGEASGAPAPRTKEPEGILLTTPLKKAPDPGKTIGIVVAKAPLYGYLSEQMSTAASKLGWKAKQFVYSTNPATGMSAAISAHVDAIWGISLVEETIKPQLEEAKSAGIPVFNQGAPEPTNESLGYYTWNHNNDEEVEQSAYWILDKGSGAQKVAYVDLPAIPYFKRSFEKLTGTIQRYCAECSVEEIGVTPEQLEQGKVASVVTAYIQSHPDVNWIVFGYGDLMTGVVPQLKAAGLPDGVELFCGGSNGQEVMELVANEEISGAVVGPTAAQAWLATDIVARGLAGETLSPPYALEQEEEGLVLPAEVWIPDPSQAGELDSKLYGWEGPKAFEKEFEEIWGVG